jgi:hypothetical protein
MVLKGKAHRYRHCTGVCVYGVPSVSHRKMGVLPVPSLLVYEIDTTETTMAPIFAGKTVYMYHAEAHSTLVNGCLHVFATWKSI